MNVNDLLVRHKPEHFAQTLLVRPATLRPQSTMRAEITRVYERATIENPHSVCVAGDQLRTLLGYLWNERTALRQLETDLTLLLITCVLCWVGVT